MIFIFGNKIFEQLEFWLIFFFQFFLSSFEFHFFVKFFLFFFDLVFQTLSLFNTWSDFTSLKNILKMYQNYNLKSFLMKKTYFRTDFSNFFFFASVLHPCFPTFFFVDIKTIIAKIATKFTVLCKIFKRKIPSKYK